jgi:hypothetical protein
MHERTRTLPVAAWIAAFTLGPVLGQAADPPAGSTAAATPPPAATAVCVQPSPLPLCMMWSCTTGEWVPQPKGVRCSDSDPCTYGDLCDGLGNCVGTPVTCAPAGPCETSACNGTAVCTVIKRAAGTVCPASTNPCEVACDGQSAYCQPQ